MSKKYQPTQRDWSRYPMPVQEQTAENSVASPLPDVSEYQPQERDSKLTAAGVMHMILSGLWVALCVFVVLQGAGRFDVPQEDEAIVLLLPVFLLPVALHLVVGVGCVNRRRWARIASIVVSEIAVLLALRPITTGEPAEGILMLAWFGTILGLSITGSSLPTLSSDGPPVPLTRRP